MNRYLVYLSGLLLFLGIMGFVLVPSGIHFVPEGSVGLYWIGGALTDSITQPGMHWHGPFTKFRAVQTSMQTDSVTNIPCGTSGGVILHFSKIDVVNRLRPELVLPTIRNYTEDYDKLWIFDRIHHAVNEFCSVHTLQQVYVDEFDRLDESLTASLQSVADQWAPGIEIISIRVTKPQIPEAIRLNFELVEAEKTKYMIAKQRQQVVLREAETSKRKAVIQAQQAKSVAEIDADRRIAEQLNLKQMSLIDDQIMLDRVKGMVDAEFYRDEKEAQGNEVLLTQEYLRWRRIHAVLGNTTIVWGDRIPSTLLGPAHSHNNHNLRSGI